MSEMVAHVPSIVVHRNEHLLIREPIDVWQKSPQGAIHPSLDLGP
jgi:hypothetical protein